MPQHNIHAQTTVTVDVYLEIEANSSEDAIAQAQGIVDQIDIELDTPGEVDEEHIDPTPLQWSIDQD